MNDLISGKMYRIVPKDVLKAIGVTKEYIGMFIEIRSVNGFVVSHTFYAFMSNKPRHESFHPFNWTFELLE